MCSYMAGRPHTQADGSSIDGSTAKWPGPRLNGLRELSPTRGDSASSWTFASFAPIVRSRGGTLPAFNRGSVPERRLSPASVERSLRLLTVRLRNRHVRFGRLANARLARTLRLHERGSVEVLAALARCVPRANGLDFNAVRIEHPRNVLHVSRERRAKERTNELAPALAPGLTEQLFGKIVRREGFRCVRHALNVADVERSRNAKFAMGRTNECWQA